MPYNAIKLGILEEVTKKLGPDAATSLITMHVAIVEDGYRLEWRRKDWDLTIKFDKQGNYVDQWFETHLGG